MKVIYTSQKDWLLGHLPRRKILSTQMMEFLSGSHHWLFVVPNLAEFCGLWAILHRCLQSSAMLQGSLYLHLKVILPPACRQRRLASTAVLWRSYRRLVFSWRTQETSEKSKEETVRLRTSPTRFDNLHSYKKLLSHLDLQTAPRFPLSLFLTCPLRSMSPFFAEIYQLLHRQRKLPTEVKHPW